MTLILQGTDNSVSSPAVQGGTAGTTTGVYYPATNQIALATNGTLGLLLDTNQTTLLGRLSSVPFTGNATYPFKPSLAIGNNDAYFGQNIALQYQQSVFWNCYYDQSSTTTYSFTSGYSANIGFDLATGEVKIRNSQASVSAGAATGTTTQTFGLAYNKSLALQGATIQTGTGITFPAAQNASSDANTLDDYEEGTWTPTVNGVNLGAVGRYTKVGRLVSISFSNQSGITGIAVNASMTCSGIPFNVVGGAWENTAAALMIWNNQSTSYPDELACGRLANSSQISMTNKGSEATTTLDPWGLSVVYFTS